MPRIAILGDVAGLLSAIHYYNKNLTRAVTVYYEPENIPCMLDKIIAEHMPQVESVKDRVAVFVADKITTGIRCAVKYDAFKQLIRILFLRKVQHRT